MRLVDPGADLNSWRRAARVLIQEKIPPAQIVWTRQPEDAWLFDDTSAPQKTIPAMADSRLRVPKAFMDLAKHVICHADEARWALLYTILWRILCRGERHLLTHLSDDHVRKASVMAKAVRREIHKTHAFVRFQKLGETDLGREIFVAWFEPEHHVIELATPFFRDRFANMDWSILTPKGCCHWIQEELIYTDPILQNPFPEGDVMENLWQCYYASIFNPARLKMKMMQSEMPKKYWKNLPEAKLIQTLSAQSYERVDRMFEVTPRLPKEIKNHPYLDQLKSLPSAPLESED